MCFCDTGPPHRAAIRWPMVERRALELQELHRIVRIWCVSLEMQLARSKIADCACHRAEGAVTSECCARKVAWRSRVVSLGLWLAGDECDEPVDDKIVVTV
jgi:hypothetical protein